MSHPFLRLRTPFVALTLLAGLGGVNPALPAESAAASPSALEARFRQAAALEAASDPGAAAAYEALEVPGFPAPDAVQLALARLLPPERAEAHWQAVINADPASPFLPEALEGLAALRETQGRLAAAAELLRRAAAAAPEEAQAAADLLACARLLDRQGKVEEARGLAETLWVDYADLPEAAEAETILAEASVDPAGQIRPERLFARSRLLLERGRRDRAVATLRRLRSRITPDRDGELGAEADLALGKALYFLRRYSEALEPLGRARNHPAVEEESRFYGARCLFGLDRGDEGAEDLIALARKFPESRRAPTYLYQAVRVLEGRRLWKRSAEARRVLFSAHPRSDEAREIRWGDGWRAFREGRFAEAEAYFRASAKGADRGWLRARGLYWTARAALVDGREEEGHRILAALIQEFPLGYYARLSREWLRSDKGDLKLSDPRDVRDRPVPAYPLDETGTPKATLARAAGYLRLGLPEGARRLLRAGGGSGPRWARFFYWAEDYRGAVRAAGKSWLDWPTGGVPPPLSPEALAYPVAYPEAVERAAREAGIHPHLLLAVAHTESHFDPKAYSTWEARGLMQFIPATGAATARELGIEGFEPEDLFDAQTALRLGARHLRDLLDRFGGDWVAAVAAYNAGSAAVERWRRGWGGEPRDVVVETIPYRETRRYVKKVATALDAYGRLDPPGLWPPDPP